MAQHKQHSVFGFSGELFSAHCVDWSLYQNCVVSVDIALDILIIVYGVYVHRASGSEKFSSWVTSNTHYDIVCSGDFRCFL